MYSTAPRDFFPGLLAVLISLTAPAFSEEKPDDPPPIRALLVTGGCSHDYAARQLILVRGIRERIARKMEWVVRLQGEGESDERIPLFESPEWAKGYDIVVHDHCFPRVKDAAYVDRILAPHRAGTPALLLHGTMMSFRTGDDRWFEFCGVTTRTHEPERSILVVPFAPKDPILKGFEPWSIAREELYRVEQVWPGTSVLTQSDDSAGIGHANSWTHRYSPAQTRIFGTTLGNDTATLRDPRFLDLVARGMLWSLGELNETAFVVVPSDRSLKDLPFETPPEPLLRPGPNLVDQGKASAFSWSAVSDSESADRVIDGDPATTWNSGGAGPGAWKVILSRRESIGAVAIFWDGAVPIEASLEASEDGLDWKSLAVLSPPSSGQGPVVIRFEPVTASQLRISVPRTAPGQEFGLREFAAYGSVEEIPSAIPVDGPHLRTAGGEGMLRRVRLASGRRVAVHGSLPFEGELSQMIPTASGSLFVCLFPANGSEGSGEGIVYRLDPKAEGGFDTTEFLTGLDPRTQIAWDGEWLYTLSGPRLDPVRRALGPGPADERFHGKAVYSLPEKNSPRNMVFSGLHLGNDGWLHGRVAADSGGNVYDADGRSVRIPRAGAVRFRRDGSGLSVEWPSEIVEDPSVPDLVEIEGQIGSVRDGARQWIAAREEKAIQIACFTDEGVEFSPGPEWNELSSEVLPQILAAADRPSIRREATLEILRRKRDPSADLDRHFAAGASPVNASALVAIVSGLSPKISLNWLVRLARSGDPIVQVPAFLALGDHPDSVNHPVFSEVGAATVPAVSAAILEAMLRSGSDLPGVAEIALELTSHPDSALARTALSFLVAREEFEVAFAVLDREEDREKWPGAFAVLSALPSNEVVNGLLSRLGSTGDPEWRRDGLKTLCHLYFKEAEQGLTWEGTAAVAGYLRSALNDPRVNSPALLAAMRKNKIPEPDGETFVRLARSDLALEAPAIEALLQEDAPIHPETKDWLVHVAADENRDQDLRLKAEAILNRHAIATDYRRRFAETSKLGAIQSLTGAEIHLIGTWLARSDHSANVDWLLAQTGTGTGESRRLAWRTLLLLAERAEPPSQDRSAIEGALVEALKTQDPPLFEALEGAPLAIVGKVIAGAQLHGEIEKLARDRSLDPVTGHPLVRVGDLPTIEIARALQKGDADPEEGRQLFRALQCGQCHNIHGEGRRLGPDLAGAVASLSDTDLVDSLLDPGKRIAPGYERRVFEDKTGRQWRGWIEERMGDQIVLRDRAWNRLELPGRELRFEWPVERDSPGGCPGAEGDLSQFSALVAFLRTLTD